MSFIPPAVVAIPPPTIESPAKIKNGITGVSSFRGDIEKPLVAKNETEENNRGQTRLKIQRGSTFLF